MLYYAVQLGWNSRRLTSFSPYLPLPAPPPPVQDYFRVPVDFALGITDVDDKIIARAKEQGQGDTWEQMTGYARPFEKAFFRDMDCLAIRRPNAVLRVRCVCVACHVSCIIHV